MEHLKRCRTSNLLGDFASRVFSSTSVAVWFQFCPITAGGARDAHWTGTNEDASVSSVISMGTLIDVPAIFISFLKWDVDNPRTTMPFPNNLFSFSCLHGFRNLEELHQNQLILRARTLKDFLRTVSPFLIIKTVPVRFADVFFARMMHSTSVIR